MKINAWIQMGCERRETSFEVSEEEREEVGLANLEAYLEEVVLDWICLRYGWGWTCDLITNDFTDHEDSDLGAKYFLTEEVLGPRTVRSLVAPPATARAWAASDGATVAPRLGGIRISEA